VNSIVPTTPHGVAFLLCATVFLGMPPTTVHAQQSQLIQRETVEQDPGPATLAAAAFQGDEEEIRKLIDRGVKPNARYGSTKPLQIAAERGYVNVAAVLIEHGAQVNDLDAMGDSALATAAANGQTKVVDLLINHGALLNQRDLDGRTPLWWAISYGKRETTKRLIEDGSELNIIDGDGRSLVGISISAGELETAKMLLAKGADPTAQGEHHGFNAFDEAGRAGSVEALQLLVHATQAGPAQNDLLSDALYLAADSGQLEAVKYLLSETSADPNHRVGSGLTYLAGVGDKFRETALSHAIDHGFDAIARRHVPAVARAGRAWDMDSGERRHSHAGYRSE